MGCLIHLYIPVLTNFRFAGEIPMEAPSSIVAIETKRNPNIAKRLEASKSTLESEVDEK